MKAEEGEGLEGVDEVAPGVMHQRVDLLVALPEVVARHLQAREELLEEGLERGARPFELDRVGMQLMRH